MLSISYWCHDKALVTLRHNWYVCFTDSFPKETINSLKARGHHNVLQVEQMRSVISAGYKLAKEMYGHGDNRKQGKTAIIHY